MSGGADQARGLHQVVTMWSGIELERRVRAVETNLMAVCLLNLVLMTAVIVLLVKVFDW